MTLILIAKLKKFMTYGLYLITARNELAVELTVAYKECIRPCNHMLTAVKTSFSAPKMLDLLKSKLRWEADENRTIN